MGKAPRKDKSGGYIAATKFVFGSPYKIRPVARLIRRKPYTEALEMLAVMPHKGAYLISKTLKSAASNAMDVNKRLEEDMLYVKDVLIDEGPRMKRVWFRARGKVDMLLKRMSHITVVVDETPKAAAASAKGGK